MRRFALFACLGLAVAPCFSEPTFSHPQYILLNKAYGSTAPMAWNQDAPSTCTAASFEEVVGKIGTVGNERRRLAISYQINVLDTNSNAWETFLETFLSLSNSTQVAIGVTIDAFEWWDSRPDLWNWFDDAAPGFNTTNIDNVEWYGWTPSTATQIAWRNWGSQFRVPPHPNLQSTAVLQAYVAAMTPALARIAAWYTAVEKQTPWLLAYVKVSVASGGCRLCVLDA